MEKRKKKMTFVIGWILRIPRLEKIRERYQEATRVAILDLKKQVAELEVELIKRRAIHQKRDDDRRGHRKVKMEVGFVDQCVEADAEPAEKLVDVSMELPNLVDVVI